MYWSPSPALIAWKAVRMVCSDEAQKRFVVTPGTSNGSPARSAALRAML